MNFSPQCRAGESPLDCGLQQRLPHLWVTVSVNVLQAFLDHSSIQSWDSLCSLHRWVRFPLAPWCMVMMTESSQMAPEPGLWLASEWPGCEPVFSQQRSLSSGGSALGQMPNCGRRRVRARAPCSDSPDSPHPSALHRHTAVPSVSICFRRSGGSAGGRKVNSGFSGFQAILRTQLRLLGLNLKTPLQNTNASLVWGGAQIKDYLSHGL